MKQLSPQQIHDESANRLYVPSISYHDELRLIRYYCTFISVVCHHLDLTQLTQHTSIYLYQYSTISYLPYHQHRHIDIIQSAIYLACKLTESNKRIRDIINVTHRLLHLNNNLPYQSINSTQYWSHRDTVIHYEQILLRCINYSIDGIVSPQQYVLHIARDLECSLSITQLSHCICNDSLYTILPVLYKSELIACTSIYIATEILNESIQLPYNTKSLYSEWWEYYSCTRSDIESISTYIIDLYDIYYSDIYTIGYDIELLTQQILNGTAPSIQQSQHLSPRLTPLHTPSTPIDTQNSNTLKQQQRQSTINNVPTFNLNDTTPQRNSKPVDHNDEA